MPSKLSPQDRTRALLSLPEWRPSADGDSILRVLQFQDFSQAFSFMTRVAMLAEQLAHHPEWRNVYGRVEITLSTHDCGGLSELDLRMARQIDAWVSECPPPS